MFFEWKASYFDFDLYSRTLSRNNCWIGSDAFCIAGATIPKLRRHSARAARSPDKTVFVIISNGKKPESQMEKLSLMFASLHSNCGDGHCQCLETRRLL